MNLFVNLRYLKTYQLSIHITTTPKNHLLDLKPIVNQEKYSSKKKQHYDQKYTCSN